MGRSSETGVNTAGLADFFYLLCLSERLRLLCLHDSLVRLQQKKVLFYCHLVVTVIIASKIHLIVAGNDQRNNVFLCKYAVVTY